MTDNIKTGGAAFPRAFGFVPAAEGGTYSKAQSGMTLRDYFAARAPEEAPHWFVGPALRPAVKPEPAEQIKKEAREWARDPIYDLDDVFDDAELKDMARGYMTAVREYDADRTAADAEWVSARYFAWRYYYADMMIAAREGGAA